MKKLLFLSLISINIFAQNVNRLPLFKSFDGTMIHYETKGVGRPVVLVHGFISNSNSWRKAALVPALMNGGFEVILLDLRGNGLSDKPHDEKKYADFAEIKDIMALMKHLGFKKYDVVGYSRGSILAARELVMDKNIRAAVLGGMGTDFTNPDWARRKMFAEAFAGKAHLYPETSGAIAYAKSINADTLVLGFLQKYQPVTSKEALMKVKTPVLVISGTEDADNGKAADLAKLFPNATLKSVPGNHNSASGTEPFAEEVVKFLKEH